MRTPKMNYIALIVLFGILFSCKKKESTDGEGSVAQPIAVTTQTDPELAFVNIPEGFALTYYAKNVKNAREMALSDDGTLYIGTRRAGNVYAVQDTDGDGFAEKVIKIAKGLNMPNGVALKNGDLYVAEVHRVLIYKDIASQVKDNDFTYEVFFDDYPNKKHHGWKFIAFGPDEKLYVPVGAPCNICESDDEVFNTITRLDDKANMEIVQKGIRNTVGFNWHPENGKLWFTDNGGDNLGDDMPGDELNFAASDYQHFGYPYCHQGNYPDPEFGQKHNCDEFTPPAQILGPHVAALGMEFWNNKQFPTAFQNKAFIAEHGSWNRSTPIGYRITTVNVSPNGKASNYKVLLDGFRDNEKGDVFGRPVDLEWMPDGSLLISDDFADCIYRLSYVGN